MAAMMPMIATTISSSIRVNPSFFCSFFTVLSLNYYEPVVRRKLSNAFF